VIFARRRAAPPPGPVPVRERWRQVFESGEVMLRPFSPAELDAVTLEPQPARPEGGLPYLQRLSPLLDAAFAATPGARTADISELASAVAGMEASGFVRPGPPAPPEGQMPVEFAGLAAAADGEPPRRVALAGDLGLITYMRCRPLFVAEVYHAVNPDRPDRASAGWQLVARGFTPFEMPGCLIERPQTPTGDQPPHVILREDRAAAAMLGWLGGDVGAYLKLRKARAAGQPGEAAQPGEAGRTDQPALAVSSATVAAGFSRLTQLSLALPAGPEVVLRALVVGTGDSGHWLLTGEQLELATPVTLSQLGDRLDDMLASASRPGAAAPPDGHDAAASGGPATW
jgi:hypothetical protein